MSFGRAAVVLAILLGIGCASSHPACPVFVPSPVAQPFAWLVSGTHGSLVVQATHQGVDADDVSPRAWRALEGADLYVTETDEATAHKQGDAEGEPDPHFQLPRGTSLLRLLPDGDFDRLVEYTGVAPRELAHLKPWVAFMLLGRSAVKFADTSINARLLERARSRRIEIVFLETWDDQVRYLDAAITPAKLALAIDDAPNLSCRLTRRLGAFRAGDDAVFINDIGAEEPVVARIDRWFVALRAIAESGRHAFVAVGIGQLLGPYGLLARFAESGYVVRRL